MVAIAARSYWSRYSTEIDIRWMHPSLMAPNAQQYLLSAKASLARARKLQFLTHLQYTSTVARSPKAVLKLQYPSKKEGTNAADVHWKISYNYGNKDASERAVSSWKARVDDKTLLWPVSPVYGYCTCSSLLFITCTHYWSLLRWSILHYWSIISIRLSRRRWLLHMRWMLYHQRQTKRTARATCLPLTLGTTPSTKSRDSCTINPHAPPPPALHLQTGRSAGSVRHLSLFFPFWVYRCFLPMNDAMDTLLIYSISVVNVCLPTPLCRSTLLLDVIKPLTTSNG